MKSNAISGVERPVAASFVAEGFLLLVIVGWALTASTLPDILPSPLVVLKALYSALGDKEFWQAAGISAFRICVAVLAATVVGTLIGILPRYVPSTSGIIDDMLVPFFSSFPAIAWAILGTVWFGLTSGAIIVVQMLVVIPYALVNASEGIKAISSEEVEMGRSFGRNRFAIFWRIELPLLRPFILAGARIAYGVCWKISLLAELFGGRSGLGFRMQLEQDAGAIDGIIAMCLAIVCFVIAGEYLIFRPLARLIAVGQAPAAPAKTRAK